MCVVPNEDLNEVQGVVSDGVHLYQHGFSWQTLS